jgi:hypothetical protein
MGKGVLTAPQKYTFFRPKVNRFCEKGHAQQVIEQGGVSRKRHPALAPGRALRQNDRAE